ncbi:volume-sensitive anion channel [Mactra antiquata]
MMWALLSLLLFIGHVACQGPGPCPTACSCSGEIIDCGNRGLTAVPSFSKDMNHAELQLENNNIQTISNNAFSQFQNLTKIFLENNNISLIESNAFRGVEKLVREVFLGSNQLTEIPSALGVLENLVWLDVTDNPIDHDHFDEKTMYEIGDYLNRFEFGSSSLTEWPTTVRHLQDLRFLNVSGGMFYTLPPDAFHGFEGTLQTLAIQNTELIALPLALARLRFLEKLHFDHNHQIGDSGVLIPSFGGQDRLSRLRYVSLIDDNLTMFPSLFKILHFVETLVLDSNSLAFVSDSSINVAIGTSIVDLSLRNCSLSRVPGALSKLTNLTKLNLADNQIHSFENSDFDNMRKLENLTITRNPLGYIANETFKDLVSLQYLDLKESNINELPEAIRFLKSLQTLKLPLDRIECTCKIAWLKQFKDHCNTALSIDGSCETINYPVEIYLDMFVTKCPNYENVINC